MPLIPANAEIWKIEQGYFDASATGEGAPSGRLRRITHASGAQTCFHTVKQGSGFVRIETEREIAADDFDRWWPLTTGRRIAKTRHRVLTQKHTWEVDVFHSIPVLLAEVELASEQESVEIPEWLARFIKREVTDDARWRNASLALHGVPSDSPTAS